MTAVSSHINGLLFEVSPFKSLRFNLERSHVVTDWLSSAELDGEPCHRIRLSAPWYAGSSTCLTAKAEHDQCEDRNWRDVTATDIWIEKKRLLIRRIEVQMDSHDPPMFCPSSFKRENGNGERKLRFGEPESSAAKRTITIHPEINVPIADEVFSRPVAPEDEDRT